MTRSSPESALGVAAGSPVTSDSTSPTLEVATPETLKSFIVGNMPLLTTFTVLAGLAGFVLTLPLGWFAPLLRAGLLVLTFIVWLDLLDQLPAALRLSHWRRYPAEYSWRLIWFAYLIQLLMAGFIVFLFVEFPRVAVPALAAIVATAVASRLGDRLGGLLRLAVGLAVFEAVLILLYPTHQGLVGWLLERFS